LKVEALKGDKPLRVSRISRITTLCKNTSTNIKALEEASLFSFPFSMSDYSSIMVGLLGTYPLAALFFCVMLFRLLKKGRDGNPNGLPLPPGPKGYPLIGNLFDMPGDKPWVVYDEWRNTYGKIFIINGLSPPIIGDFR
jgi:hypothetical protein